MENINKNVSSQTLDIYPTMIKFTISLLRMSSQQNSISTGFFFFFPVKMASIPNVRYRLLEKSVP